MKWKSVPGWPYEVSNSGKVRRIGSRNPLVPMMTGAKHNQYETVLLCNAGAQRAAKVHRLVAEVFIGPVPADKPLVLHKDGNRRNNRPSNLRYGTQAENMQDMSKHHRHKHKLTAAQKRSVFKRRVNGEQGRALATELGVSEQYVCDILKGRR